MLTCPWVHVNEVSPCAQLEARSASGDGVSIPGIDPGQVAGDGSACYDGDFGARLRLGKTAAEVSGVPAGDLLGSAARAEACADGASSACAALDKQITQTAGIFKDGTWKTLSSARNVRFNSGGMNTPGHAPALEVP
jgi:hypothetical protein